MAANDVFQPVQERGWRHGLTNLLRVEFGKWFRTNMWWIMAVMWTLIINGILAGLLWSENGMDPQEATSLFSLFLGLFPTIAIIIILQDSIVSEKESGTAAWVMSKPVSRPSFVLSKLAANLVGVLVAMLLVPSLVAYIQLSAAAGKALDPLQFASGLAVLYLNMAFYLTLTLMLGTFFNQRGPVIGIPLALAIGQNLLFGIMPFLIVVLPWTLAIPAGDVELPIAAALIRGVEPALLTPLYSALILTILFIAISLWRFNREEF